MSEMLTRFAPWLKQLSLVPTAEKLLAGALPLLILVATVIAGWLDGWTAAVIFGTAHVFLWLACLCSVPRTWSLVILLWITASLLNYCVYAGVHYPGGLLIAYGYAAIAAVISLSALVAWLRMQRAWRLVGHAQTRDDLRWVVSAAPLYFRYRMLLLLRHVGPSAGSNT